MALRHAEQPGFTACADLLSNEARPSGALARDPFHKGTQLDLARASSVIQYDLAFDPGRQHLLPFAELLQFEELCYERM